MKKDSYLTEGIAEYVMTLFPSEFKGVCVDVGAFHPRWLSNSYIFEKAGWDVYCIEPNPNCIPALKAERRNVLQLACGSEDKDNVDFYVYNTKWAGYNDSDKEEWDGQGAYTGLLKHEEAKGEIIETVKVQVRMLDHILDNHIPRITTVDYLSIDVERNEMEVLRGFTLNWFHPKVIVIENEFKTVDQHGWLASFGYRCIARMGVNDIYQRAY